MEAKARILSTQNQYEKLMHTREALLPELQRYITKSDAGWSCLQHPLVYDVPYVEELNALSNHKFRMCTAAVKQLYAEKKWEDLLRVFQAPYRLQMLARYANEMPPERYWPLLADIWTEVENAHQQPVRFLHRLWNWHPRPRTGVMKPDELEMLQGLPKEFPVFRGMQRAGKRAGDLSWSLNRDVAFWFAKRWKKASEEKTILTGLVKRSSVWAYLNDRNEEEIVVPRRAVFDVLPISYRATNGEDENKLEA